MDAVASTDAVVSPSGKVHAVRALAKATVCGLDYRKRPRHGPRQFLGWVSARSSFEHYQAQGQALCANCLEGLAAGTGPYGS